jgi:hypothetical protein
MSAKREKQKNQLIETIKKHQELLKSKADLEALLESDELLNTDSRISMKHYINLLIDMIQELKSKVLTNEVWEHFDEFY